MRNTAGFRYTYTSWQSAYPGRAVDLTALEFPAGDHNTGAEAALKLLDLGPAPKAEVVAEIRENLRAALITAQDKESAYAAVLYSDPKWDSEHIRLEFSVYDNVTKPATPADVLAGEVLDPAEHEVVSEGTKDVELAQGPAARLFQTTVTRDPVDASFEFLPRLTVCGTVDGAGALFVIRGQATGTPLADALDERVMTWARGLSFRVDMSAAAASAQRARLVQSLGELRESVRRLKTDDSWGSEDIRDAVRALLGLPTMRAIGAIEAGAAGGADPARAAE